MPTHALMLATPSSTMGVDPESVIQQLMSAGGWTFEFKYDGIRALLTTGPLQITNRTGRDITYRYPDVVAGVEALDLDVVLDGEIVCVDETGRPDFHRIHRRDAQATLTAARRLAPSLPAQFVAFDVLWLDGVDLRGLEYRQRRAALEGIAAKLTAHGVLVPPVSTDGPMLWRVVQDMQLEGLVAKRNTSAYVGRRSPSWLKLKRTLRLSAVVAGYEPGEGSRASTFGALRLQLLDGDKAVDVGTVGSGFTDIDVRQVWRLLRRGDPFVVEVAYLEASPTGQLRQPVFKGVRAEVAVTDCTIDQLS